MGEWAHPLITGVREPARRYCPHALFRLMKFIRLMRGSDGTPSRSENVAAHLTDDGSFVVEAYSPSFFYRLRNDNTWTPRPSKSTRSASMCCGTIP